jgi:hypothetical protein
MTARIAAKKNGGMHELGKVNSKTFPLASATLYSIEIGT